MAKVVYDKLEHRVPMGLGMERGGSAFGSDSRW